MDKESTSTKGQVKRWSASRKMDIVMRYVRGETLEDLSREIGVAAPQIEEWHRKAIIGIEASLKERGSDPNQVELDLAKKRIGELCMENELLRERNRKQGVFFEGRRLK